MKRLSALVVLVPEAESLVGPFRIRYDTSAAAGMPAHITVNFPFLPAGYNESETIPALKDLFSQYYSFRYTLAAVRQFPGVIYLSPSPDRPFIDLIEGVFSRFPHSPPYGGEYSDVVPHLTVAAPADKQVLEDVNRQFVRAASEALPLEATVREVWFAENKAGRWILRTAFKLAGNPV